ncbi:sialidase family protein [Corynebacterium sp. ES2775-CONJ]|uniref:sialidase family protein n=1 Tax=Corynebacterium sp. ES2775-CONJ TaxID=2974029 RepID=UPI002167BB55|nr:sialidase family protein [Corynebacterium sp. ES2775-CONJ]
MIPHQPPHLLVNAAQLSAAGTVDPRTVELRIPAIAFLDGSDVLLLCDSRLPADDDTGLGGAMPSDLPNPNSLIIGRGTIDGPIEYEIFRSGSTHPRQGFSDPAIIVDGVNLAVVYARSHTVGFFGSQGRDSDQVLHSEIAISHDCGRTFRTHSLTDMVVGDYAGAFVTSGHAVVNQGHWILPVVMRDHQGRTWHRALISHDKGDTWSVGEVIGDDMDETCYGVHLGQLYLSARRTSAYETGELGRYRAISSDYGRSWNTIGFSSTPPAAACNASFVDTPHGLVFAYSGAGRQDGFLEIVDPHTYSDPTQPISQKPPLRFHTGPCGYIDLAYHDGYLVVVYEVLGEIWMCSFRC